MGLCDQECGRGYLSTRSLTSSTSTRTACKVSLELQNGQTYSLLQFHVHTPSEHTIEGHHYNGEIHFVHKEDGGDGLLVVGLLLNAEENVGKYDWVENVLTTMDRGNEGSTVAVDLGCVKTTPACLCCEGAAVD